MKNKKRMLASVATFLGLAFVVHAGPVQPLPAAGKTVDKLFNEEAEAQAQVLRAANPQQYNFVNAKLGDILRRLGKDANISFISLPDDSPEAGRNITLSIKDSPFKALETVCKVEGLTPIFENNIWYIRTVDDKEIVGRAYSVAQETVKHEVLMGDICSILGDGPSKADAEEQKAPLGEWQKSKVIWKAEAKQLYVMGTRIQHQWVQAYLKGARVLPQ